MLFTNKASPVMLSRTKHLARRAEMLRSTQHDKLLPILGSTTHDG